MLEKQRHRWEENVKTTLLKVAYVHVMWIKLAHNRIYQFTCDARISILFQEFARAAGQVV
jgi:uncharacterized membrane protein